MASDWERLQIKLKERFDGEMDYDSILFMIGLVIFHRVEKSFMDTV